MLKKDEEKKKVRRAAKTSNPVKATKAKVETKISAKTRTKPTQSKKKTEATFTLEAPQAVLVSLAGSFNEWDPTASLLKSDGDGMWSCTLAIAPGEYEYRFVVDGVWCDDPVNGLRRPNGFGTENCVLIIDD